MSHTGVILVVLRREGRAELLMVTGSTALGIAARRCLVSHWLRRCWAWGSALPGFPPYSLSFSWGPSHSVWGHFLRSPLGPAEAGFPSQLLPAPCPDRPVLAGEGAPARCRLWWQEARLPLPCLSPPSVPFSRPGSSPVFVSTERKYTLGNRQSKQRRCAGAGVLGSPVAPAAAVAPRAPRSRVAVREPWWTVAAVCQGPLAWCWSGGLVWQSLPFWGLRRGARGLTTLPSLCRSCCCPGRSGPAAALWPGCHGLVPMVSWAERGPVGQRSRRASGC